MKRTVLRVALDLVPAAAFVAYVSVYGCAARQPAGTAAGVLLNCEAGDLASAAADLVPFGIAKVTTWISGDGVVDSEKMLGDLAAIRTDLGKCVIAAAVAALDEITARRAVVADGPGPREAFSAARGQLAWPTVRVSGTTY